MIGNPDRNFRADRLVNGKAIYHAKPRRGAGFTPWKFYLFVAGVGLLAVLIAWRLAV